MSVISECMCTEILAILVALAAVVIAYFKWTYKHWERKGLNFLQPKIPFGYPANNPFTKKVNLGYVIKQQYDEMKLKQWKHGGSYLLASPVYIPVDAEYVKNILTRDFQHFTDRGVYYNEEDDPLSAHLFFIGGAKWRNLRVKLTPTFTSGKMKMMFQTLVDCGEQLKGAMDDYCVHDEPIDIKDVLGRFTTDIIGSCAFGIECNTFKNPDAEFRRYGKKVFDVTFIQNLKNLISFGAPKLAALIRLVVTPKEVSKFFMGVITDTVNYREKNNINRKDFMQLLIDIKNNKAIDEDGEHHHDGKTLTMEELAAQAFVFFLAGFETSSTTMTFCLYELSLNQDIQQKVREEIVAVLANHNGKLSYDAVMDMKYMQQVLDETLRKYPPVPALNRKCTKPYRIPDTDVILDKDTVVLIPVLGLHHDPEYFPDPEKFDPERFSEENEHKINHHTYLPFGEGPRNCIGLRFGVMQSKVGLTVLLKNYKFSLNKKTHLPLNFSPNSFILSTEGGMWLNAEKIN